MRGCRSFKTFILAPEILVSTTTWRARHGYTTLWNEHIEMSKILKKYARGTRKKHATFASKYMLVGTFLMQGQGKALRCFCGHKNCFSFYKGRLAALFSSLNFLLTSKASPSWHRCYRKCFWDTREGYPRTRKLDGALDPGLFTQKTIFHVISLIY